jgi:hypothetical protein
MVQAPVTEIPQHWIRERTSIAEISADWFRRRQEHNWWTPPHPAWCRDWEGFVGALREGDELYHYSESTTVFPTRGHGREGYVILRDGVQVRSLFWVGDCPDDFVDESSNDTNVAEPVVARARREHNR